MVYSTQNSPTSVHGIFSRELTHICTRYYEQGTHPHLHELGGWDSEFLGEGRVLEALSPDGGADCEWLEVESEDGHGDLHDLVRVNSVRRDDHVRSGNKENHLW